MKKIYFIEETLKRKQQEMLTNIEKERSIISTLTNKNSALKQEEECINLEIRGIFFTFNATYN